MIEKKFVEYDHLSDSKSIFKHGHKFKLKSIDIKTNMPSYLSENVEKYKNWFDFDFEKFNSRRIFFGIVNDHPSQ